VASCSGTPRHLGRRSPGIEAALHVRASVGCEDLQPVNILSMRSLHSSLSCLSPQNSMEAKHWDTHHVPISARAVQLNPALLKSESLNYLPTIIILQIPTLVQLYMFLVITWGHRSKLFVNRIATISPLLIQGCGARSFTAATLKCIPH